MENIIYRIEPWRNWYYLERRDATKPLTGRRYEDWDTMYCNPNRARVEAYLKELRAC